MLSLYLLRHGKSDWNAESFSDHDRPLAPRGRRGARRMGRFLSDLAEQPDAVVSSTALRARATAELAAEEGAWTCPIRLTEDLYLPAPGALLAQARAQDRAVNRLLLVGHEPTWSEAVARFAGGGQVRMVTAALARLDFSVTDWSRVDFGQATLAWMITPKLLAAGME